MNDEITIGARVRIVNGPYIRYARLIGDIGTVVSDDPGPELYGKYRWGVAITDSKGHIQDIFHFRPENLEVVAQESHN